MKKLFFLIAASFFLTSVDAQITERERPAEWQHLVKGARFMDRFLPMPGVLNFPALRLFGGTSARLSLSCSHLCCLQTYLHQPFGKRSTRDWSSKSGGRNNASDL